MNRIDARELVHEVLPRLRATRHLVETTLRVRLEACHDAAERRRLQALQEAFALEMTMIRLNLEHLLRRYAEQLDAARREEGQGHGLMLSLDDAEAAAIERIRQLHARARRLQTG